MMPEEIIALREEFWGRSGSRREKLVRALFTHIDEQASQITTLKAICIKERLRDNYSCIKIDSYNPFRHHKEKLTPNEAKDQLAKEYPEIDWEE